MTKNGEGSHAKKVTNFNELISFVTGYGEDYNPSNESIALPALRELAAIAANSVKAVNGLLSPYNKVVAIRETQFAPLSKLVTRIMNGLKSSGVSDTVYNQVLTVARKLRGERATAIDTPEVKNTEDEPASAPKHISVSQMGFNNRAENFEKLVELLAGIPQYNPSAADLKISALTELSAILKSSNQAVIDAEVPLSNARNNRDVILYRETTGLCDIALAVKNEVISVFGTNSRQYKQISKLRFQKIVNDDLSNAYIAKSGGQPPQPD